MDRTDEQTENPTPWKVVPTKAHWCNIVDANNNHVNVDFSSIAVAERIVYAVNRTERYPDVSPIDELKDKFGWTSGQVLAAIRDENKRQGGKYSLRDAALIVLERARAGLPTYAQLEARVGELEAQNKRLFAVLDMAKDTLVGYGIRSEAVQQTIAAIMTQRRGPAMTAELLRDAADCLDAEVQQLNAMAREIDHRTLELAHEYVTLVDAQRSGEYSASEVHEIGGRRSVVHDELLQLTGLTRSTDMYAWCQRWIREREVNE